jgi:hypothetical protein
MYAWANMGTRPVTSAPWLIQWLHGKDCDIPHLAKNERDAPNFLHAALEKTAYASFVKERRRKFVKATEPHRKSGMWGTRASS